MTWQERVADRGSHSRTYEDSAVPGVRRTVSTLIPLLYTPQAGGSGSEMIDMTPQRVQNEQLDGWQVTANTWHYALGQPGNKTTDGWVGYGGQQGLHWLIFRLARLGYLHWPARAWQDIGGAPTYDRANLSQDVHSMAYGPNDETLNVESTATWSGIWTTSNGGDVSLHWRATGDRLKEDIVINQAAREWVQANRPPDTPITETFFGLVFQLDWGDVSHVIHDGETQAIDADIEDMHQALELHNLADEQLGILPAADLIVADSEGAMTRIPLQRRFWVENGQHYMMVGICVDALAALATGALRFDPTVAVVANWDDGFETDDTSFDPWWVSIGKNSSGQSRDGAFRFQSVDIPQGATITAAALTLTCNDADSWTVLTTVKGIDEDNTADWSASRPSQRTKTTATVDWDFPSSLTLDTEYTSPDLSTIIEEIVGRSGWQANNALALVVEDRASASNEHYQLYDYDEDSTKTAQLDVTYSVSQTVQPSGIASGEAFGTPTVTVDQSGSSGGTFTFDGVFTDAVEIQGSQDVTQLRVLGHSTQTAPLQTWETSAGGVLGQVAADGRIQVGDLSIDAPDALIEANNDVTLPTTEALQGIQSRGLIRGVISDAMAWIVQELELLGNSVSGLHTALRGKLLLDSTGDVTQAQGRVADFEAINNSGGSSTPAGNLTAVQSTVTNQVDGYLDEAVGVGVLIQDDGTSQIQQAYGVKIEDMPAATQAAHAIHTGTGTVHVGDDLELKIFAALPGNNPPTGFLKVYAKLDAGVPKLYAKDASGTEYQL